MKIRKARLTIRAVDKVVLVVAVFVASLNIVSAQSAIDTEPPRVLHETGNEEVNVGQETPISANIVDDNAVESAVLYYRTVGQDKYKTRAMEKVNRSLDTYLAELRKSEVQEPGVEYYIVATDKQGNSRSRGFSFEPLLLSVNGRAVALDNETNNTGKTRFGISKKTLLYTGLGVLAVGVLLSAAGGSDESDDPTCPAAGCGTLSFK